MSATIQGAALMAAPAHHDGSEPVPATERVTVYLTPEREATLDRLARLRFGGNRSEAFRWAVDLAAVILAEPATLGAEDAPGAVAAYCREVQP